MDKFRYKRQSSTFCWQMLAIKKSQSDNHGQWSTGDPGSVVASETRNSKNDTGGVVFRQPVVVSWWLSQLIACENFNFEWRNGYKQFISSFCSLSPREKPLKNQLQFVGNMWITVTMSSSRLQHLWLWPDPVNCSAELLQHVFCRRGQHWFIMDQRISSPGNNLILDVGNSELPRLFGHLKEAPAVGFQANLSHLRTTPWSLNKQPIFRFFHPGNSTSLMYLLTIATSTSKQVAQRGVVGNGLAIQTLKFI